jgi:hypothetical protein
MIEDFTKSWANSSGSVSSDGKAIAQAGERITVHRQVQTVVKDDMPPQLFSNLTEIVITICDRAIPDSEYSDNETRLLKQRFREQVIVPLFSIDNIQSRE